MDGQFSQQLANLRRAASRAGRDDGVGGGGRDGGRDGGRGGRGGRGGGRGGHGSNTYGRRDDYSGRGGDGGGDYRGRGGSSYRGGGRRDDRRDRRYDDRHEDRRHDDRARKRGRYDGYDGYDDRHGRDHRRGVGRDRGGGRFGGRWDGASRHDHRRRNDAGEDGQRSAAPLSELVETVAQKYQASEGESAAAAGDGKAGTKKKRRHIALLFLTIDDIPHEHVWREWLKSGADDYLNENEGDDDGDGAGAGEKGNGGGSAADGNALVSVLCHAKHPERIQSPWLRRRHLLRRPNGDGGNGAREEGKGPDFHSHRPGWGSVEITRAMLDLLEEGLRMGAEGGGEECVGRRYLSTPGDALSDNGTAADATEEAKPSLEDAKECDVPPVDRFVFVSESCLPVTTLKEMEMALFGPKPQNDANGTSDGESKPQPKNVESLYNKSWVNARSTPNNGYAKQLQWDAVRPSDVPQRLLWKADQWLVLARSHGEAIASLPHSYLEGRPLWPAFKQCRASDEMYFPTALSILGLVHRPSNGAEVDDAAAKESCAGNEVRRRKVTYCDWSMGAKNPASFTAAGWGAVVEKARGEGCLLARKFVSEASMPGGRKGGGGRDDGLVSVADWITAVAKRGST